MKSIHNFAEMKQLQEKITVVTGYDYWTAQIIAKTPIDAILVGDSAAMVMHGHDTTLPMTVDMMRWHVAAVVRGAPNKFVIADMPFLSFRKGVLRAMQAVEVFMQAGAKAIKLEGVFGHEKVIKNIVESGVPVMGHIGLTPQSIYQLGGMKVQGKEQKAADLLMQQAQQLEELGCFSLVLECVPKRVAQTITEALTIPTIGIGAGPYTSGQVLVLQDLLGFNTDFQPRFLKKYLNGHDLVHQALCAYDTEVKAQVYPDIRQHCYDEVSQ